MLTYDIYTYNDTIYYHFKNLITQTISYFTLMRTLIIYLNNDFCIIITCIIEMVTCVVKVYIITLTEREGEETLSQTPWSKKLIPLTFQKEIPLNQ